MDDGGSLGAESPVDSGAARQALLTAFGLISEQELALLCAVDVATVQRWRSDGSGPVPTKLGGRATAYARTDVAIWLLRQADRVPVQVGKQGHRK